MAKITRDQYLMGRDKKYEKDFTKELSDNTDRLIKYINLFLVDYKGTLKVTSGFRPAQLNNSIRGAANKSNHLMCLAVDFEDMDLKLWKYVMENLALAKQLGIWFEDKAYTSSWVHMQIVPPNSGNRIFIPNSNPPDRRDIFDGKYDKKYN